MTPSLLLCLSLSGEPLAELRRLVNGALIERAIQNELVGKAGPDSFLDDLNEFDQLRVRHLYTIAASRRVFQENIELFEKAQEWTNSPERKLKYRRVVEDLRQRLLKLDSREREIREDGPPLPDFKLPPRP